MSFFSSSSTPPHLTLQVVSRFGPLDLHVIRKHCVLVQSLLVVLVAGEGLGILSRHQMNHVWGEVVLPAGRQRVLAVLLVAGQPPRLQAVQETRVLQYAFDPNVLPFLQQVVVFVVVLQRHRSNSWSLLYFNIKLWLYVRPIQNTLQE